MIFELEKLTKGSHDAYIDLYESINRIYRSSIKNNRHGWMDEWMDTDKTKRCIYSSTLIHVMNP